MHYMKDACKFDTMIRSEFWYKYLGKRAEPSHYCEKTVVKFYPG